MNHLNAGIRQNRSICPPFTDRARYIEVVKDPSEFRASIDSMAKQWPELFPPFFHQNSRPSQKEAQRVLPASS